MGAICCLNVVAQENTAQPAGKVSSRQQEKQVEVSISGNRITITNAPVGGKLEVYNVLGMQVEVKEIKEASAEYTLDIAKGYYIIRIEDVVRKIFIR